MAAPKKTRYRSWPAYRAKANELLAKGLTPSQIEKALGFPFFDGKRWHLETDKGKLKRKDYETWKRNKVKSDTQRVSQGAAQTYGEANFPKGSGAGQQHHIRKKSQYAPFFEGASEADANELARYAAEDLGTPLGDKDLNAIRVKDTAHTLHHNVERKQGFTKRDFPKLTEKGPHPSNFTGATLDQRKYALYQFVNQEQPKIDDILIDAMRQGDPQGLKAAEQAGTLVRTRGGLKFARNATRFALPAVAGGLALSVLNQQSVRAETMDDDSVLAKTRRGLADAGVVGDSLAVAGTGLSATGAGAIVGVPLAAAGEVLSMGAGIAEMATDAFVTNAAKAEEAVERGGQFEVSLGGLKFKLPELGISERLGLN